MLRDNPKLIDYLNCTDFAKKKLSIEKNIIPIDLISCRDTNCIFGG
jgi:hypothetical protein